MRSLALFVIFCFVSVRAFNQDNYWQQELNYTIDVTLNDIDHTLNGFLKLRYTNHSPDTLQYLWFHLWPNAYKNDKTALSEQLLHEGKTDFYFSGNEEKGYINRLDFRINNASLKTEDDPKYIDLIKLILPEPLVPSGNVELSTPFHVKLQKNFSRGGHTGQSYQITQWYPKPAVYDKMGWHPMPYLDQGEFYSEFGSYDVRITVPSNYVVAATGDLQDNAEKKWIEGRSVEILSRSEPSGKILFKDVKKGKKISNPADSFPLSSANNKTLQFIQNNVHDFAWFADKRFFVNHDTLQLLSGKIIDVYSYFLGRDSGDWKYSNQYIKEAVLFRSAAVGEYPFNVVSVVDAKMGVSGGMEYPTIACISLPPGDKSLEFTIEHEVGHNWFYGILASNERDYPWMDEGMNTYYDFRFFRNKYGNGFMDRLTGTPDQFRKRLPEDEMSLLLQWLIAIHKDQPINTTSEQFSNLNYEAVAYKKAADWMNLIEDSLGTVDFDLSMKAYFSEWKFRHPFVDDFRASLEKSSHKNLSSLFGLLDKNGPLVQTIKRKMVKPVFLFNLRNTDSISYINIIPVLGYNKYDKLMAGVFIHNFNLPPEKFRFFIAPLYATNSKRFNTLGRMEYSWYPGNLQSIKIAVAGSMFSKKESRDTLGNKVFERFYKLAPSIRFNFKQLPTSSIVRSLEWKIFFIGEKDFDGFVKRSSDSLDPNSYVGGTRNSSRYLNQLTFTEEQIRSLYPYDYELQFQQGQGFYRVNFTGNYFFNYGNRGGLSLRFFASKFGFLGNGDKNQLNISRYEPKLLGVTGEEDFTYGNYFLGRTATVATGEVPVTNKGLAAQQIMIRDGGFKLRLDYFEFLQGRSENWLTALNLNSSFPEHLLPVRLPLKLFLDVGTYAEAFKKNVEGSRLRYVAGLQLPLFKNILNVYAPIFYSKEFRENLKTFPEINTFWKRLTFSIDTQRFNLRRITGNKIPF